MEGWQRLWRGLWRGGNRVKGRELGGKMKR